MPRKTREDRPSGGSRNLAQYGLFDVPTDLNFNGVDNFDVDDDSDLEAELLALSSDSGVPSRPKRASKKTPGRNLTSLVQDGLRDIPSDDDISVDENDPDLLSELNEITGVAEVESAPPPESPVKEQDVNTILQERLKMYLTAESNAKEAGETSRARRFNRGVKTIKDLIKQAGAGKSINNDDIPPEVTVNIQKRDPIPQESNLEDNSSATSPIDDSTADNTTSLSPENVELLKTLNERRDQYKSAALQAKRNGESQLAVSHIKVAKQFEIVIKAVENGQPVDVSLMPGPPVDVSSDAKEESEVQNNSTSEGENIREQPVETQEEEETLITANSVGEALEQRLQVYRKQEEAAKEQGNSGKVRRMNRIIKQYEQAVKLNNAGKPIPFEDLPTPPGFAPIPGSTPPAPPPPPTAVTPSVTPSSPPSTTPSITPSSSARTTGNRMVTTRSDQQVILLTTRQREFRLAAVSAKQRGEMDQAREFLRTAKGFEPLIAAASGGMPVDIGSLPLPPSVQSKLDTEYGIVMAEECVENDEGVIDIMSRLETQLTKQLKMCLTTRDHHKAMGDVAGAHRFENLALSVSKDLDVIRIAKRTSCTSPPRFRYENKDFSIVKSFTELNDNDLQLNILRGINFNCTNPKEIDTYVKYDFPYPQEEPVRSKTATIKDTNNPEYEYAYTLPIQRTSRPCLRVFKRQALKLEVYAKGGFFRGDTLLGTVNIKLQPLETQCEIHDSYDLMDGRKKVGGKLEVQLRLRNPLLSKEVQKLTEKWLVLDQ